MNTLTLASPRGFTLKQLLVVDALTCLVTGIAFVAAAAPLAKLLGLPSALVFYAGVLLFPCAALMACAARNPAKPLVWAVILGNFAWAVASAVVAFEFDTTAFGVVFIFAQAVL